jgi:hypothetical protein
MQVLLQTVPEVERQPHIFGPILGSDTPIPIGQEDLKQQKNKIDLFPKFNANISK